MLRLLDLPPDEAGPAEERISQGHARALLSLIDEPERMHDLFTRIQEDDLTVREAEALAREAPEPLAEEDEDEEKQQPAPRPTDPHIEEIAQRLRINLGTKVAVLPKSGGGEYPHRHDARDLRLLAMIAPRQPRSPTSG